MNIDSVKVLLSNVSSIQKNDELLARKTGRNFNIFQILKMGHYEVKTHSPMIADLLNPKGLHGQGSLFLKLFIGQLRLASDGNDDYSPIDPDTASVHMEYYIGEVENVPGEPIRGGRIDILIKDSKGKQIFIENKIHAIEQDGQLDRYHEYDRKAPLIFLTLDGSEPESVSLKSAKKKVIKLSYAIHIIAWLKKCREKSAVLPAVRESLTQYIDLLKTLTNQSTNKTMNKKIVEEVLKDKGSKLNSYRALIAAERDVYQSIQEKLVEKMKILARDLDLEFKPDSATLIKDENYALTFSCSKWEKLGVNIRFNMHRSFCDRDYGIFDGCKGTYPPQYARKKVLEDVQKEFSSERVEETAWWPARLKWHELEDNWESQILEIIGAEGENYNLENIGEKVKRLQKICDELAMSVKLL